jgi:hypothetical protein
MTALTTGLVLVPAVLALTATLYATHQGIRAGGDTATYLSVGRNLATGHGLRDFSGDNLTSWPSGLPGAIAAGHLLGVDGAAFARYLNAFSLALTVLMAIVLLRRHVGTPLLIGVGAALVTASGVLLDRAEEIMSECGFIALTLVFLVLLEDFLSTSLGRTSLFGALIATAWLAFLFRYVGLVLIPVGTLSIVSVRERSLPARAAWAGAFTASAAAVPIVWLVRNHVVVGHAFGPSRGESTLSAKSLADLSTRVVGNWISPWHAPLTVERMGVVIVGLLAVAAVLRVRPDRSAGHGRESLVPLTSFLGLYVLAFAWITLTTGIEWPDDRMLSPSFVPLIVLATVGLDRLAAQLPSAGWSLAAIALPCALAFGHIGHFVSKVRDDAAINRTRPHVVANSTKLGLRVFHLPRTAVVYSNSPEEVWAAADRPFVLRPPVHGSGRGSASLESFLRDVACKTVYFAWRRNHSDPFLTPAELGKFTRFKTVLFTQEGIDGALYRVTELARAASVSCT